jgi:hypothetical protein
MAIQFVNNIDFNLNQAESIVIEKLGTDPTSDLVVGRIIFNTASDTLKQYISDTGTGSPGWVEVGGGVTTITAASGTYISFTDAVAATGSVNLGTFDLNAVNGTAAVGERYLTKNNTWAEVATIPGTYTWTVAGDNASELVSSGDTITFTGGPNCSTSYSSGSNTLTINSDNTTYDLSVPTGTTDIRLAATGPSSNDDVTISGTTNEVDITRIGAQELRVGLTDDVTITGELTVSGTGQSSFGGQVTIPTTPVASTDAASKAYVDSSVAGGLIYQGGFDGSTGYVDGTTDYLDSRGTQIAVNKGWTYTVTVAGTFYGDNVEVGDVLIAEDNLASGTGSLSDWTTVQNNIDLADLNTVGIGNVNPGEGINVVYLNGTATVSGEDSSASNKGIVIVNGGTGIDVTYLNGTATVSHDGTNQSAKRVNLNSGTTGISRSEAGGITTFTIDVTTTNHFGSGANPLDVMVEVLGATANAGDTVYADVGRSGNNITIKFTGSVSNGSYQALLNNVA